LPSRDDIEELSVASKFEDDIEVFLIAEVSIDLDDVGVVEEALNFEFTDELNQEVIPDDSFLLDHLQAHDHARPNLTRQVDAPELPFAQSPNYLKVLLREPVLPQSRLARRFCLITQERGEGTF
jgi:hypothetical protein